MPAETNSEMYPRRAEFESTDSTRRRAAWLALAFFIVLIAWVAVFRYSGEGDAVLHYLNAREGAAQPASLLYAWTRPLFKLLIVWAAPLGNFPTRAVMCASSGVLLYQTVRLAQDLRLDRPTVAGWMLLLQPFVFALASDTMSEIPMALGLVLATRLWVNGRLGASCLIVGLLPMVRPEGFLIGALWGVLVVLRRAASWPGWMVRTACCGLALSFGIAAWCATCARFATDHDPLLWVHYWSWPAGSYEGYPSGNLFYHVYIWPIYTGFVLIWPFLLGLVSLRRREMLLPWAIFGVVFVTHSILFWGHWFASAGLPRIFACTGPFTALICLCGWNTFARLVERRAKCPERTLGSIGAIGAVLGAIIVVLTYGFDRAHWYTFPAVDCARFLRDRRFVASPEVPKLFFGNKIVLAELNLPIGHANVVESITDPAATRKLFRDLPIGSVGVWDNQQAQMWHGISPDELIGNGFELLYESTSDTLMASRPFMAVQWRPRIRFVVLRKTGPYHEPNAERLQAIEANNSAEDGAIARWMRRFRARSR